MTGSVPTKAIRDAKGTAVLLLAHGSPKRVEDVPEFLTYVTGGRPLAASIVEEIQHRYTLIGHSPLHHYTNRQAERLALELKIPVYVGMRNWRPFIPDAVRKMTDDGVREAVVICMAPQNSRTSVGLYRKAVLEGENASQINFDLVDSWHDHPLLVRAFAEKLRPRWEQACCQARTRVPVIFTAHSVPQRTVEEGDPYEQQARETAALVAMEIPSLNIDDWTFAFQSQGASGNAWLGPRVEEAIISLKKQGHAGVLIQPIGFLCDHVEILYDIDIAFREFAQQQGMQLWRAESLNDSPTLTAALADIARSRLSATSENVSGPLVQIRPV